MRLIAAVMWALAAGLSLLITFGNVALVGFQQKAEAALLGSNLGVDLYASSALRQATRWSSECLIEGLRLRKDLQLKQLDLSYGHEPLDQTQQKLVQAHSFLLDYLSCNPSDGSAWLAAAMVMNTMNNDADITMQYLAFSKFYSPNDEKAIKNRTVVLQSVSRRLKSEYRDMFLEVPAISTPAVKN